jgi:hypothetical protein
MSSTDGAEFGGKSILGKAALKAGAQLPRAFAIADVISQKDVLEEELTFNKANCNPTSQLQPTTI